jgi:hypothetical protein
MNSKMKQLADASLGKIASLERMLSGVLKPIKPRKEFVHGIAQRFHTQAQSTFLVDRLANWHLVAMLIAVFISLGVFLAVVGRVIQTLMGKKRTA